MTAVTSFTVFHKNPEARDVLGRGFVVGKVEQVTSYGYHGVLPNTTTPAFITENKIVIKYEVLWDNQRHVSPSLHAATDLEWEALTDEYLAISADDGDEEGEEETDDDTTDETVNVDAAGLTTDTTLNAQALNSFDNDNGNNAATV